MQVFVFHPLLFFFLGPAFGTPLNSKGLMNGVEEELVDPFGVFSMDGIFGVEMFVGLAFSTSGSAARSSSSALGFGQSVIKLGIKSLSVNT
jgi:hypothetical protein